MGLMNMILRRKQETHIDAARVRQDIEGRFNPVRRLEPANLSRWIDEFSAGNLRPLGRLLYDLSDRDDTWKAAQRKTVRSVARCGWEIRIKEGFEKDPDAQNQVDCLLDFYGNLTATDLLRQTRVGGMAGLIRQMMLAERDYYSVHELLWRIENGRLRLRAVWVPVWMFEAKSGHLRFLPEQYGTEGVPLVPGEWMAHCGDGLGVACAICATYKRLSLSDWLSYGEHNATPGLHGKTQARKGSQEWKNTVEAVAAFAKEWSIVTGSDVELNKIDLGASGSLPYQPLIERMDRAISALWRGADLSTLSANTQGASLQGEEMDMLEQSCAEDITETIRYNLDAFVLGYYFGFDAIKKAEFILVPVSKPNVDQEIRINDHLVQHGAKIAMTDEVARFGRRLVDAADPDDLPLEPAQQPNALPQAAPTGLRAWNSSEEEEVLDLAAAHRLDFREVAKALAMAMQKQGADFQTALQEVREQFPEFFRRMGANNQAARALEAAMRRAAIAEPVEAVANEGTSEGARKGWETRRANGWTPKQMEENRTTIVEMFRNRKKENKKQELGVINSNVAKDIERANPKIKNVEGAKQTISTDFFRHSDKQHGPARQAHGQAVGERNPKQAPLTEEDYKRLPDVIGDYDRISKGETTRGNHQSIVYQRKFKDGTIYYVETAIVRNGTTDEMEATSMWKKNTGVK